MPRFDPGGLWLERVNKNLLPLLDKFGIKRQGAFGLSNVILPIVNVETLEEVLEAAQLISTVNGNLAAVNDEVSIAVPAGEIWKLEHLSYRSVAASAARGDAMNLGISGVRYGLSPVVPEYAGGVNHVLTAFVSFPSPIFLAAGDTVAVQRVTGATTATSTDLAVWYRTA